MNGQNTACSACYGSGYGVDEKPCPFGCRPSPSVTSSDNVIPLRASPNYSLEAELAEQIKRILFQHEGRMSLVTAIGILEVVKAEILAAS